MRLEIAETAERSILKKRRVQGAGVLMLALILAGSGRAVSGLQQTPPPESLEIQAATKIDDLNARIKELERIKAAYPGSGMAATIDKNIFSARIGLCETVDAAAALQKPLLSQGTGFARLDNFYFACDRILNHRNIERFDRARVTAIIESYVADYLKATADPEVTKEIPEDQKRFIGSYTSSLFLFEAQARLREGRADKVLETLEKFKKAGFPPDAAFAYYSAEAYALLGRAAESYESYFTAAVENFKDSDAKVRALHAKIYGTHRRPRGQVRGEVARAAVPRRSLRPGRRANGEGRPGGAFHRIGMSSLRRGRPRL